MYHDNQKINDIILSVINDGKGDQCGFTYDQRVKLVRQHDLQSFRQMADNYAIFAKRRFDVPLATHNERITAGNELFNYYSNHVIEMDRLAKQ